MFITQPFTNKQFVMIFVKINYNINYNWINYLIKLLIYIAKNGYLFIDTILYVFLVFFYKILISLFTQVAPKFRKSMKH